MKKLCLVWILLPFLFLNSSCKDKEKSVQPNMATYVKGVWAETKVTIKVTNTSGGTVAEDESAGYGTYTLDGSNLLISYMPDFKWVYSLSHDKDQHYLSATYGLNYFMEHQIIVVSDNEMIWQSTAQQPDANGQMTLTSEKKIYLSRQ